MDNENEASWRKAGNDLGEEEDLDVILYRGPIRRPYDEQLIELCRNIERRKNVLLILVTLGGDAHAAYRIARCLQEKYSRFSLFISGTCKSAGTLVAVGADEIVFGPHGEMGPLDVQMPKSDELWEMRSGLTVMSALDTLEEQAFNMVEQYMLDIKMRSGGQITFRTSADIAAGLTTSLLEPIYGRIDPMHVGEAGRAMQIAAQYGNRLNVRFGNLRDGGLASLVRGHADHACVIDRQEAEEYFFDVRKASPNELLLADGLAGVARYPSDDESFVAHVNPKHDTEIADGEEDEPGSEDGAQGHAPAVQGDGGEAASVSGGDGDGVEENAGGDPPPETGIRAVAS